MGKEGSIILIITFGPPSEEWRGRGRPVKWKEVMLLFGS
jgi:hypothetical protein